MIIINEGHDINLKGIANSNGMSIQMPHSGIHASEVADKGGFKCIMSAFIGVSTVFSQKPCEDL